MKRFSQLMPAGVPVEFDYPARSFTLLACLTHVEVRFGTGSQTQEVADEMTQGMWYEAETPFRKVVITSPVDQVVSFLVSMGKSGVSKGELGLPVITGMSGINPVVEGSGPPGWVSGDFSGLAASASTNVIFDLGENWMQYGFAAFTVSPQGPSSGLSSVRAYGAPSSAFIQNHQLGHANATASGVVFSTFNTANGAQQTFVRPNNRFLLVRATNADAVNAMGANATTSFCAYPIK